MGGERGRRGFFFVSIFFFEFCFFNFSFYLFFFLKFLKILTILKNGKFENVLIFFKVLKFLKCVENFRMCRKCGVNLL